MRNAQKRPPREILTAKQRAFVVAVVSGMSAHRAAIEAGYQPSRSTGAVLMRKPQIAAAINAARAVQASEAGWTQADVLAELKTLAWSNVAHYVVRDGVLTVAPGAPANAMAAVSAIKYTSRTDDETGETVTTCEFRLWDKPGALKLAGRHVGLFPERIPDDRVEQAAAKMLQASVDKARRELEARAGAIDTTATEVPRDGA